jgi:hypothetical protein
MTSHPEILETEGPFTQESRPSRTFGDSVGGMFEMEGSDWSNGIRYHPFDTRSDTEFKVIFHIDVVILSSCSKMTISYLVTMHGDCRSPPSSLH